MLCCVLIIVGMDDTNNVVVALRPSLTWSTEPVDTVMDQNEDEKERNEKSKQTEAVIWSQKGKETHCSGSSRTQTSSSS